MARIPRKVRKALEGLKKKHEHYVEVKVIKGLFCVFESEGKYDPVRKRAKKITHYLGRILPNGEFVEAVHRKPKLSPAIEKTAEVQHIGINATEATDETDLKLVTSLSMNGRATYSFLGELAGIPKNTAYNRIKRLVKRYGIRYLAEINMEKLGYLTYITLIKFTGKKPGIDEIKEVMANEPVVQLVMVTNGEYDMMVSFLARSARDVADFIWRMRSETFLGKYTSEWYTTTAFYDYGFMPVRPAASKVISDRVWKRGRDSPQPQSDELTPRDAEVLIELNANGSVDFAEIDRRHGYDSGAALYSYYKLKKKGTLKRVTVSLDGINVKYYAIVLARVLNGKKLEDTRAGFLNEIISDGSLINKYAFVSDIQTPTCVMFIMPVLEEGEVQGLLEKFEKSVDGIENHVLIATDLVVGSLCLRRFDRTYSPQYRRLVDTYKTLAPVSRVNYEESKGEDEREPIDLSKI